MSRVRRIVNAYPVGRIEEPITRVKKPTPVLCVVELAFIHEPVPGVSKLTPSDDDVVEIWAVPGWLKAWSTTSNAALVQVYDPDPEMAGRQFMPWLRYEKAAGGMGGDVVTVPHVDGVPLKIGEYRESELGDDGQPPQA